MTFFYADDCPLCPKSLRELHDVLQDDFPYEIRKPTVEEAKTPGFSYPALMVPAGVFPGIGPTLVVGDDLAAAVSGFLSKS